MQIKKVNGNIGKVFIIFCYLILASPARNTQLPAQCARGEAEPRIPRGAMSGGLPQRESALVHIVRYFAWPDCAAA